jgi:hypothetical protein
MSVFTNSARGAADQAGDYVSAIIGLLQGQDPMAVLRATPDRLRQAIDGVPAAKLRQRERPGKWSIAHVLQHLADAELVWGWRARLILAQERPTITGYDQDLWADRLGYDEVEPDQSIETFTVLRRGNLRLLERATPADLKRVGVHAERGEESIEHVRRLNAGHDLMHLQQIARIRGVVEG